MNDINTWVDGYKVRGFDWIDGKNLYLNIQYYKSGASIEQPPALEKSILIAKTPHNEELLKTHLHSIIHGVMIDGKKIGVELSN